MIVAGTILTRWILAQEGHRQRQRHDTQDVKWNEFNCSDHKGFLTYQASMWLSGLHLKT